MLFKYLLFHPAFYLLYFGCASPKINVRPGVINATALKPFGRYVINSNQNLELISSAVHFGFTFEGKDCQIFASLSGNQTHNYLQYEIDGEYRKRVRINSGATQQALLAADKSGKHTVWVYKATEAHTGPIIIEKITGNNIAAIQRRRAPLIEFIGNSITCGAAADASLVPCGSGKYHDQHNAYLAYGPRVARSLNFNFLLSSVSGIGIYRNWNSDGPAMPDVYEKVDFQKSNMQQWDFNLFKPDIISIALGTNDFSRGDGVKHRLPFDSASFVSGYVRFVKFVKLKNPDAQIVLLGSPMINGAAMLTFQKCLSAVKEKVDSSFRAGKRIALFFFQPMQAHGCSGHPDVEDHAVMAKQLVPFFKGLYITD